MTFNPGSKGPGKYRTNKSESEDFNWGESKKVKPDESVLHSSTIKHIERIAVYGDELKTLTITQPNGAGGIFHIAIDRYHQGTLSKVNSEWATHLNERSELTGNDILIPVEMVEEVGSIVPRTETNPSSLG